MENDDKFERKRGGNNKKRFTDEELKEHKRARNKSYYKKNRERLIQINTDNYKKRRDGNLV